MSHCRLKDTISSIAFATESNSHVKNIPAKATSLNKVMKYIRVTHVWLGIVASRCRAESICGGDKADPVKAG